MAGPLDKLFPGLDEGAIARTLSSMTEGQRAMTAARLPLLKAGQRSDFKAGQDALTAQAAADLVQIAPSSLKAAVQVRARATPEEIAAAERGEIGVTRLYRRILTMTPEQRKAHTSVPVSARGDNGRRLEQQRLESKIWSDLRVALEALSGMPSPKDVVAIAAKGTQQRIVVDSNVDDATLWLMEFADAWNARGKE